MAYGRFIMDNFISINLHNEIIRVLNKMNKNTIIYIALLLLTTFTFLLGQKQNFTFIFTILVLITTFIKGQLIIDYFMELKNVDLKYRLFLSIWLVLVISLIGLFYFLPST